VMSSPSPFRADVLSGKVALITGGATGICYGIAEVFGKHGAKLALMGRRQNVLDEAVAKLKQEGIQAIGIQGDVRDFKKCSDAVAKVVQTYGKLDIVVNGAAGNFLCTPQDLSANAFQTVIGIDLLGTFNVSKAAFDALAASKDGLILNVSATLHYGATPFQTHASAAKAGVDSLTRSLAIEWGHLGIRVNGIAPGPIADTEGSKRLGPPGGRRPDQFMERIPMRRMGTSTEIGYAALYLASKVASYITGETLVVDGGSWLSRGSSISPEMYEQIKAARSPPTKQSASL